METKPASTQVTLPKLPTTATLDAVFGTGGASPARVVLCADRDLAKQWCGRHADGKQFMLDVKP